MESFKGEWNIFFDGARSGRLSTATCVQLKKQIHHHIQDNTEVINDEISS
jgi:hypothetical protein